MTTVAITGSTGKTTTAWLVRAILEAVGQDCGLIGSTGYELGETKFTANVRLEQPPPQSLRWLSNVLRETQHTLKTPTALAL